MPVRSMLLTSTLLLSAVGASARADLPATTQPNITTAGAPQPPDAWRPITIKMTAGQTAVDMANCGAKGTPLFLSGMPLTATRPAAIVTEPKYLGTPYYGAFKVGDGPKSMTYFCVDQIPGHDDQLHVDLNQNGDLTDDGNTDWDGFQLSGKKEKVFNRLLQLHASYGTPLAETESGSCSYFLSKVLGEPKLGFYKTTAMLGTLPLDGKSYSVQLQETTMDNIYTVPADLDRTRFRVMFCIDLDGDGTFKGVQTMVDGKPKTIPEVYSIGQAVPIGDRWFFVRPNISGTDLKFIPAAAPASTQQMVAAADPFDSRSIVKNGVAAPDFVAQGPDGKPVKLSDFRGKVVLLDFWATWCGPCQQSMPPLEKIYQRVKDQGVVVLSVNVLDEKDLFDQWIAKHSGTDYHFNFAFDPAGKDDDNHKSIATKDYGVVGIPTMFVIDRDGKVFAGLEGAGDTDRLKIALRGLSIKTD